VEIESEGGRSYGEVTIASGLDKVETAILAAALETIDRVGPCRSDFQVTKLEDVRAAKRREIVERATDLLAEFEGEVTRSADLIEEVRQAVRVEDITEYEGLPAGPRVSDSDAIIVVEGRADVLQLLKYGIKNAVAVEGTDVPQAVADLTSERTVTAFLDGDRGGDLILKELGQVGEVNYVAFAPEHRSVEDLARDEVMAALREKVPMEAVAGASSPHETVAATDGSARPAPPETTDDTESAATPETTDTASADQCAEDVTADTEATEDATDGDDAVTDDDATATADDENTADAPTEPETLAGYVQAVVDGNSGEVVLLDGEFGELASAPAGEAFDAVADADVTPTTVVLDGELDQRLLDVAAQRGVEQIVPRSTGEFVKQPTGVRIRMADQF
jgi:DNA primase